MIEILVYLFENYHDSTGYPKTASLARKLSSLGFEAEEISEALNWLDGLKSAPLVEFSTDTRAIRFYTAEEMKRLGGDCLSFIAFLESAKVITPSLRELVVERCLMLDGEPMPLARFKIVVLMVLWSREQDLDPLIVEELLYDSDPELMH